MGQHLINVEFNESGAIPGSLEKHEKIRRKVKQVQPMRLYPISGKQFEDSFENTQWRKVKQMQPM